MSMMMMRMMTGMNCAMISNATGFVSQLLNVDSPAAGSLQCPALLLLNGDEDDEVEEGEDEDDDDDEVEEDMMMMMRLKMMMMKMRLR